MKLFSSLKAKATAMLDQYKQQGPAAYAAAQQAIGGLLILDGLTGIDNPFGGKKRPGILGAAGGIVFGVIFMFVPTIFNHFSGYDKMTATTTATVVSVGAPQTTQSTDSDGNRTSSTTCSLTVKFTAGGQDIMGQSPTSSGGYCSKAAGQTVEVNYDPANPQAWATDTKTIGAFIMVFFWAGVLVVITSLVTTVIRLLSIIFGWKILKSGRALAKTLPEGTNLHTVIEEVRQDFKKLVFGGGGGNPLMAALGGETLSNPAPVPTPPSAVPAEPVQAQPSTPTAPSVEGVAPVSAPADPVASSAPPVAPVESPVPPTSLDTYQDPTTPKPSDQA